jgi:predicted nucleic acid-binding protein
VIVVDASIVLEILMRTERGARATARVFATDSVHAPHLLDLEVAQVLRRFVLSRHMQAERAREALEDLLDLPITRYPHAPFLSRIWELRTNLTAYDAVYAALAEALPATLVTCDRRLKAALLQTVPVELH